MTTAASSDPSPAAVALGDPEALALLRDLVAIAPTNLEDPPTGRYEKPHYTRAAERIADAARAWGLDVRWFEPVREMGAPAELRGIPRPNLVIELAVGAKETVLLLAHYDVVPVPTEQRARWATPPDQLTLRSDGRLYGRGSNDDLGSGVVGCLLALRRLAAGPRPPRNVRLLVCCDEETGGEGGVESMKHHDAGLPPNDPTRLLAGDVALIPDGSPHVCVGSSGAVFLDATSSAPIPLAAFVEWGESLAALHEKVRRWRSRFKSADWPDHNAPEPVITGRVTLTRFDLLAAQSSDEPGLVALHAETDAANQIAESVALAFRPDRDGLDGILTRVRAVVPAPFRVAPTGATGLAVPPGTLAISIIGRSAHGGYPHAGLNPVPPTLELLARGVADGWIDGDRTYTGAFAVDLRLPPEMPFTDGRDQFLGWTSAGIAERKLPATVVAPVGRCRGGYALAEDHPSVVRLARIVAQELGGREIVAEYGGTDASSLAETRTASGEPMPAIVFGSMDRAANIHQAEESVDPTLLAGVARTIERFVREP